MADVPPAEADQLTGRRVSAQGTSQGRRPLVATDPWVGSRSVRAWSKTVVPT